MSSRTEIPSYDIEVFARESDPARRDTQIPAFDVGTFAREADVESAGALFAAEDVPIWATPSPEMSSVDHRIAFLMLNIDGVSSFETVIRLSHVPEAEANAALASMLAAGLIVVLGRPATRASHASDEPAKRDSGIWSREAEGSERWTFAVQSEAKTEAK